MDANEKAMVANERARIVAMNPLGYPPKITQLGMAPRLDTLDGKTVYLVDLHFNDSGSLLDQIHGWFAEHLPQVKVEMRQKRGMYPEDDPELFREIKEQGDAMILGVGH